MYEIAAKRTQYKGVWFRSRLEARWAAFFDNLRWPWIYEPFDLVGWSPDFALTGAMEVLVEVKPLDFSRSSDDASAIKAKVSYAAPNKEVLLLGNGPINQFHIGLLGETYGDGSTRMWSPAQMTIQGGLTCDGAYFDRIFGQTSKKSGHPSDGDLAVNAWGVFYHNQFHY